LFRRLRDLLRDPEFICRHRESPRDFVRDRKLPLPRLVAFLTNLVKGSVQDELDQFFGALSGASTAIRGVGKSALTQARRKLKASAFIELSGAACASFYEERNTVRRFRGFRLVAIDGTRVRLPDWPDVADRFGRVDCRRGRPRAMAQTSLLFDVLNGLVLDAAISPRENGELTLAVDQIGQLGRRDLLVADRGYDAFWILSLVRSTGAHFCIRFRASEANGTRREIAEFLRSGKGDSRVELDPGAYARGICGDEGLTASPLEVRLVRIKLRSGETEVLATSLLDVAEFPAVVLAEIYGKRWAIEERIKALKGRVVIERFTGKTVHSVEQDFQAKVFVTNLVQLLVGTAQRLVDRRAKKRPTPRKHPAQVNLAQAISKSKDVVSLLLLRVRSAVIADLLEVFGRSLEPIRPGRRFKRDVSRVKLQTHSVICAPCR
jgi:hypothetical protein